MIIIADAKYFLHLKQLHWRGFFWEILHVFFFLSFDSIHILYCTFSFEVKLEEHLSQDVYNLYVREN